jgi:D-alanine transfer protein
MTETALIQPKNLPLSKKACNPHIYPAITVLLILICALIVCDRYGVSIEDNYVHYLAPFMLSQSSKGTVIKQAAFRQPDLMLIFGSSEMLNESTPYRAYTFFSTYPTGFNVFEAAKSADTSLNIAQDLAAIGPQLKGKKVVISFTPSMFEWPQVKSYYYAENFSRMHAGYTIYSPYLSMPLKRKAAIRMLDYPDTLIKDPVLTFAIQNLVANTFYNDILYFSSFPLGMLDNFILRMQDHFAIWKFGTTFVKPNTIIKRRPKVIDWNTLIANAEAEQKIATNSNSYGFENKHWAEIMHNKLVIKKPGSQDNAYIAKINISKEWGDFEILLGVLKELGAKPLILSRPINGTLYTAAGISSEAQQVYYTRLEKLAQDYGATLVDFKEYTDDRYFSIDITSHTGRKGWVLVDQTLDAFYHDRLK